MDVSAGRRRRLVQALARAPRAGSGRTVAADLRRENAGRRERVDVRVRTRRRAMMRSSRVRSPRRIRLPAPSARPSCATSVSREPESGKPRAQLEIPLEPVAGRSGGPPATRPRRGAPRGDEQGRRESGRRIAWQPSSKHMSITVRGHTIRAIGGDRCASTTSGSSATASTRRWCTADGGGGLVLPAALRLGAGLRLAARRGARAASSSSARPRAPPASSATSPTPTCWRRVSTTPAGAFRVLDFAPRFEQHERILPADPALPHRRTARRARRAIRVLCDPRLGWRRRRPRVCWARNHIAYEGYDAPSSA